jgi:NAD(P)-dependent dehydrogenase (short-subunit alcohol dehydrogenase family)
MRQARSGRIVNLSSMGGKMTFPGGGVYHATKYSVEALSDVLRFEVKGFGIHVVIIEPGLIRTNFSRTAVGTIAPEEGGPYGKLQAHVARATVRAYEKGITARLAGEAGDVAKVIEKAATTDRPKPRYTVTPSARIIIAQRKLLGDRGWDAMLGTQFPRPGK